MTVNRFCSSGLQTIALAAQRVMTGEVDMLAAGGLESVSLVQNEHMNTYMAEDPWLLDHKPEIFMTMLATAEVVAGRYGIDRERQDAFALRSQLRTAAAQEKGRFDAEIVPISTQRRVVDRGTGEAHLEPVTLSADECNRPGTTAEGLASLPPVTEGGTITAGNASQLSDGAAASVVMRGDLAERRGIESLGTFRHFVVAGCEPTRWASARCSRSRACSSAPASTPATSGCGSSTRRSRARRCTAPRLSGCPRTGSTSTAARSRSVTRTA